MLIRSLIISVSAGPGNFKQFTIRILRSVTQSGRYIVVYSKDDVIRSAPVIHGVCGGRKFIICNRSCLGRVS